MTIKTKTPYKLKNGEKMNEEQLGRFRNVLCLWKQQLKGEGYDEAAIYSDPLDRGPVIETSEDCLTKKNVIK